MNTFGQTVGAYLHAWEVTIRRRLQFARHDERGSVTIQEVLWALAAIAFVGIVVGAINLYLRNQVAKIH